MKHADRVRFEEGEQGWELVVETEEGATERFNVHSLAWDLVDHVSDTLGDWRREGLRHSGVSTSPRGDLSSEDLEAYPPGSPKWLALQEALEFGQVVLPE